MALHQFETPDIGVAARATDHGRFETAIRVRGGSFLADEPVEVGGGGAGPTPYELLSAALAACTSMTLRLYAERKRWALPGFTVEVAHSLVPPPAAGEPPRDRFDRLIAFDAPLEAAQEAKMLEIADKCPVHRTLMRGFEIHTALGPPDQHPTGAPPTEHELQMEQACVD